MTIKINKLMNSSGVQFGTSGVRGLVTDMTDVVCFAYVAAFLQYLTENKLLFQSGKVGIAGDLRSSTPRVMNAVAAACKSLGFQPINYGNIPSPAIALYGLYQEIPTIMVTGSHIPDDRNGIKFNSPLGEILKADEEGVKLQQVTVPSDLFNDCDQLHHKKYLPEMDKSARTHYIQRFIRFFPKQCIQGIKIGLYEHSSVSRDCFKEIFEALGAEVISLGRSDTFIAVDTEAIRVEDVELAKQWSAIYNVDCIVSTDGDGDRPLISDETGKWLRGDIAGVLCAQYLDAEIVITPVSSNTLVEKACFFNDVIRTKIGSPYVIEAMQEAARLSEKAVIGYEANGGFLQQTDIKQEGRLLSALPTRDAAIVPLTIILLAKRQGLLISQLLNELPQRYTFSDRIKNFPSNLSKQFIAKLVTGSLEASLNNIKLHFSDGANPISFDETDGLRITFDTQDIVHLRPSGNAPEFRCYTEAGSQEKAKSLNNYCMTVLISLLK